VERRLRVQEMEERARKVEELERDIAQTIEAQVKENGELNGKVMEIEDGLRSVIGISGNCVHGMIVEEVRMHVESLNQHI
jgi:hypothetical protein